jgi:ribulose-phosphate 3-epimerase
MKNKIVKLAPSILAADFARLGDQVAEAERAAADRIHVDIMDMRSITASTKPEVC